MRSLAPEVLLFYPSPEASAARRIKLSHLLTFRALAMAAECQTVLAVYFLR